MWMDVSSLKGCSFAQLSFCNVVGRECVRTLIVTSFNERPPHLPILPAPHLWAWVTKYANICPLEVCVALILLSLPACEPRRGKGRGQEEFFLLFSYWVTHPTTPQVWKPPNIWIWGPRACIDPNSF